MKKEKLFNIILFILIFITILSIILIKPIRDLDEIWNYNFARNVANGLVPYRDFNMLQMPLLSLICGVVLKIVTNQLFLMRILAALLCSIIMYITYKLFNMFKIKKQISIIFTFIIGYLLKDIFCIDYNWGTLLLVLLIIYKEINIYIIDKLLLKDNIKNDLLLGFLAGLTVILKQTSGILICIVLLGNKLLFVKNKNELKIYLKVLIYRLMGMIIPILVIFIYLIWNNAFNEFISYTIKGVSGFSNFISYKTLINFDIVGILAVLVPITFMHAWYKSIIKEKDKNSYFLLVYGLAMFVITFPISDKIHFLIGSLPIIILILYDLYNICLILYKKSSRNKKALIRKILNATMCFLNAFIILGLIIHVGMNFNRYLRDKEAYSDLNHYRYISIDKNLENQIKVVDEFILNSEKSVKILDATAAVYMIPINKYNKDYDMLLKGNIGENGEERIIEDIKSTKNTQYLVLKENYSKNWQTPLSVIRYVEENKQKIGQIGIFNIYK